MTEKVKYDTQKETETAWFELEKIPTEEVTDITIMILARNHAPSSGSQVLAAMQDNPGLLYKYTQPGRLLIDNFVAVITEHIAQQLAMKFQERMQQEQMAALKAQQDKLAVAPAGTFDELAARRAKRKGN